MLLAVDIGNSTITIGLVRAGVIGSTRRARTDRNLTPDELELLIEGLLRLDETSIADVDAFVATSVVPALTSTLEAVAGRRERTIVVANAGNVPIPIRVERPAEVGPDRLVNALAATRLHGTPAVVVDLGTATTFDCVDAGGAFVGGAIAQGLELGLDALATRTALLPRIELEVPQRAIGRDTVAAMRSGAILGYQALVAGLLARIRGELAEASAVAPGDVRAVLTGGLSAAPWARGIDGVDAIEPLLTLRGLVLLHAEVTGGRPLPLGLA